MTEKFEGAQLEIEKCHENITRQANINHAQAKQIEEMSVQLDGVANSQKEAHEKIKIQIEQYQNEIDIREMEINRLKKLTEQKDRDFEHLQTQHNMQSDRMQDIEEELEMKSGENNRLRKQCADLEKAIQDLYHSRKGNGSLQIELDSLKLDNERLLALLKETTEYGEMDDEQIQKCAMRAAVGSVSQASNAKSRRSASTAGESTQGGPKAKGAGGGKEQKNNDWIPTEAVRTILKIRDQFNGNMSETCISQILYELNSIWREIMRKENNAIKKRLNSQIQDLKRQIVGKQAFDKEELMNEIQRTKKELAFTKKKLKKQQDQPEGAGHQATGNPANFSNELENSLKLVETINMQKRVLETENEELKSRLNEMINDKTSNLQHAFDNAHSAESHSQ